MKEIEKINLRQTCPTTGGSAKSASSAFHSYKNCFNPLNQRSIKIRLTRTEHVEVMNHIQQTN
jgi:hypothetical protein